MTTVSDAQEIQHREINGVGIATLNRPKALNALNTNMVTLLLDLYRSWDASPSVNCIILKGTGGKAFCAGGDVKSVVQKAREGDIDTGMVFFDREYQLNYLIHTLRKPHVALLDGITMGGGAGLSVHGTFRVATEKTLFAMPECAIGLYPDVGGSFFLPRLPGGLGLYLGLAGARLKGVDVRQAGVATHYVPSALLPELEEAIVKLGHECTVEQVREILDRFEARAALPDGELSVRRRDIDAVFGGKGGVEEVHAALAAHPDQDWAQSVLVMINKGSPTSQKLTFEQLRRGAALPDLRSCLTMEHCMMANVLSDRESDFIEGVRAVLIDRSNDPAWRPASLQAVSQDKIASYFRLPASVKELRLAEERQRFAKL